MSKVLVAPLVPLSFGQKIGRISVAALVLAIAGSLVYALGFLVAPVVLGFLVSYVLRPIVDRMEDGGVPRALAVLFWFGVGVGICTGLGFALWPSIDAWLKEVPDPNQKSAFELELERRLEEYAAMAHAAYPAVDWQSLFVNAKEALETQRRAMMETLPALALSALSNVGTFLLAPIIGLFLLLDGTELEKTLLRSVPNRYFEMTVVVLHRADRQIAAYLRGAAAESALVTILLTVVLIFAGMPNALLFGCIYGALNVIPLAGPLMGAGAGLLFSLLEPNAPTMGVLFVCYAAVYVVDAAFINPLVVGKSLNLHPLTIIVGISVGGHLGGVLGMLIAIPVIAVVKSVVTTVIDEARARTV